MGHFPSRLAAVFSNHLGFTIIMPTCSTNITYFRVSKHRLLLQIVNVEEVGWKWLNNFMAFIHKRTAFCYTRTKQYFTNPCGAAKIWVLVLRQRFNFCCLALIAAALIKYLQMYQILSKRVCWLIQMYLKTWLLLFIIIFYSVSCSLYQQDFVICVIFCSYFHMISGDFFSTVSFLSDCCLLFLLNISCSVCD